MVEATTSPRRALWTALFVLATLAAAGLPQTYMLKLNSHDMADDAMISARYALNLQRGDGLAYNTARGDGPPVEGYSNFLWVMAIAGGLELGFAPRLATAVLGGLAAVLATLALGLWVRARAGPSFVATLAGLLAAALLASCPDFNLWAVQGLETSLFALLALLAAALAGDNKTAPLAHAAAFLAIMTRPDGMLVAMAVLAADLAREPASSRAALTRAAIFLVAPLAAYLLFKIAYFGAAVPNTFYAKTGLGPSGVAVGASYIMEWARAHPPAALLLAAGIAGFGRAALRAGGLATLRRSPLLAPALLVVPYFLFIAAAGGDFMPGHRFVMHALPVVIGLGAIALAAPGGAADTAARDIGGERLAADAQGKAVERSHGKTGLPRARFGAWAAVALLAAGIVLHLFQWRSYLDIDRFAERGTVAAYGKSWRMDQAEWYGRPAAWLLRNAGPGDLVAAGDIGYIGYVSGTRVLDTNGLVDRELARRPGAASLDTDPAYVIAARPDFIVVMVNIFEGDIELGHSAFDRAFLADASLREGYERAAELPGWTDASRSMDDGVTRSSRVAFQIYRRR